MTEAKRLPPRAACTAGVGQTCSYVAGSFHGALTTARDLSAPDAPQHDTGLPESGAGTSAFVAKTVVEDATQVLTVSWTVVGRCR